MPGPMRQPIRGGNRGPGHPRVPGKGEKVKKGTFGRLLRYLFSIYKGRLTFVAVAIIVSSVTGAAATMFVQRLIDTCITPGIQNGFGSVAGRMARILVTMAVIYAVSVISAFIYTQILAVVTQGTLKKVRDDMFSRMQDLPIRYFDTHPRGTVMSTYTSDTDTLRQMIGQSIPQLFTGALTILSIVLIMLYYSIWMTLAVFAAIVLMTGRILYHYTTRAMTGRTQGLMNIEGHAFIEMNENDAAALGIRDGERVRVRSRRGELTAEARVGTKCSPGESWMPFHFPDGDANWLTNAALDKFARIPEYKVCAIRIEKIPDSEAY